MVTGYLRISPLWYITSTGWTLKKSKVVKAV